MDRWTDGVRVEHGAEGNREQGDGMPGRGREEGPCQEKYKSNKETFVLSWL